MTSQPPATLVDAHELILQESGYVVSVLTETDIDDYVALVASAYRGEDSKKGWTTEADLLSGQRLDAAMAREMLAEAWVVERWGARALSMSVISKRSELIAYYERRGYERTGETEPFPYGDERFGVPMVDDLEFVTLVKQLA